MNTHQRWAQKMMRNEGRPIRDIEKEAADRERRRIRRALAKVLKSMRSHIVNIGNALPNSAERLERGYFEWMLSHIDAATRTKKGKRK